MTKARCVAISLLFGPMLLLCSCLTPCVLSKNPIRFHPVSGIENAESYVTVTPLDVHASNTTFICVDALPPGDYATSLLVQLVSPQQDEFYDTIPIVTLELSNRYGMVVGKQCFSLFSIRKALAEHPKGTPVYLDSKYGRRISFLCPIDYMRYGSCESGITISNPEHIEPPPIFLDTK